MLDLHVLKIIACLIVRIVLFLDPSSFTIHSIQETPVLEEVLMEIFSCLFDTFLTGACDFLLI